MSNLTLSLSPPLVLFLAPPLFTLSHHLCSQNLGVGLKVDKNFANLSPEDKKVLESSSKALDALDKVKEYGPKNLRPYDKVYSYLKQIDKVDLKQVDLKQIDNVKKPGRIKQAIKAAGNLGSELLSKLSKYVPSKKSPHQDKKEEKTRS